MKLTTVATSSTADDLKSAITEALPGCAVEVGVGQPGHYSLSVSAEQFRGKSRLTCQRDVYRAIAHLMKGDSAPVHAIDRLQTATP